MSRNRFELLLANLHFANNEIIEENSRLERVLLLIHILTDSYQEVFSPGQDIVDGAVCNNNTETHQVILQISITFFVSINIVYQKATSKKMEIRKFRELLVTEWLSSENTIPDNKRNKMKKVSHHLEIRKN
ncbi:hypothetical protein ANTQUA_LOCUS9598 [Anthophora quadrimaculata]